MSNETAGEHYMPREVIRLMVHLLFAEHEDELAGDGVVRSVFDPACGTGRMLTSAKEAIQEINPAADVLLFGQEINTSLISEVVTSKLDVRDAAPTEGLDAVGAVA